jgi:hypothetical protein
MDSIIRNELDVLKKYEEQYKKEPSKSWERIIEKQKKRIINIITEKQLTKAQEKAKKITFTPTEMKQINVVEKYPEFVRPPIEYELTAEESPMIQEEVVVGEKVAKKRSDLPRLRKNVMADIDKYNINIGIPLNTLRRMRRQAETGQEKTVLKLAKELQEKYESKYLQIIEAIKLKSKQKKK